MAKISIKNTKNEIIAAYKALLAEKETLEKQLSSSSNTTRTVEPKVITKTVTVGANVTSVNGIIASLEGIHDGIGQAISATSTEQVIEADKISEFSTKLDDTRQVLASLYNVDLDTTSLEDLLDKYIAEKEAFEITFTAKSEAFETEITDKTEAWDKECDTHNDTTRERNVIADTNRKRERVDYDYKLKQDRAAKADEYAQERKKLAETLAEMKEAKDLAWAEREKEVSDREISHKEYAENFEALEVKQSQEIKKAEAEAKAIIERDHKVKMKLFKAEVAGEKNALDLQIQALENAITKQNSQLNSLTTKLEQANEQIQTIALRKLELQMTANQDSYAQIHELAMEQAKNSGKGK